MWLFISQFPLYKCDFISQCNFIIILILYLTTVTFPQLNFIFCNCDFISHNCFYIYYCIWTISYFVFRSQIVATYISHNATLYFIFHIFNLISKKCDCYSQLWYFKMGLYISVLFLRTLTLHSNNCKKNYFSIADSQRWHYFNDVTLS